MDSTAREMCSLVYVYWLMELPTKLYLTVYAGHVEPVMRSGHTSDSVLVCGIGGNVGRH